MSNDRWLAEFLAGPTCPGCGMTHGMVPAERPGAMTKGWPTGTLNSAIVCLWCKESWIDSRLAPIVWARFSLLVARGEVPYSCAGCEHWRDLCSCDRDNGPVCKYCGGDASTGNGRWACAECTESRNSDDIAVRIRWTVGVVTRGLMNIAAIPHGIDIPAGVFAVISDIGCILIRMAPINRQLTAGSYPRPVPGAGIVRWWQPDWCKAGGDFEPRWYGMPAEGDRAVVMLLQHEVDIGLGDGPSYYPLDVCYAGGMTELDIIRQAFGQ